MLLLIFMVPAAVCAQSREPIKLPLLEFGPADFGDIRGFVWGVKPEDVRKFEQGTFFEEVEGNLFYLDYIARQRTLIEYGFFDKKLWRARLDFQNPFNDSEQSIQEFQKVQAILDERYGPSQLDMNWINETYKGFPNRWGHAIYRGDLQIRAVWENDRTSAVMTMKADKYVFEWRLTLTSREGALAVEKAGAGTGVLAPEK